jgi:hypothetical protein
VGVCWSVVSADGDKVVYGKNFKFERPRNFRSLVVHLVATWLHQENDTLSDCLVTGT